MEYNESNFIYLRKTSMEKYYDELVRAEHICEYFPYITKIIVRKVIEVFLKDIAEKNNIESHVSAWVLLNNIKSSSNIFFPEEIYNGIEVIISNGYNLVSRNNRHKIISKHPIEILKIIQRVLCWYLKITEVKTRASIKELNFKAPSTIEYMQKEISKVSGDIKLREGQINNLRQKIIDLSGSPKRVSEINKIIITIKEEKFHLEKIHELMSEKIEIQKNQVLDAEKNYKMYDIKIDNLKKSFKENQELLLEKESQLLKCELQKQELRNLISELYEQDILIKKVIISIEEELKIIREAYENLLELTDKYQDILETIEFSYDKELQKILEAQKNNIKIKINFEDRIFNENVIDYNKNIIEAKRKILISRELLNENLRREIKYDFLYKGFLRLDNKELKIIYTIINNTISVFSLLNKSRDLLSRLNEERFLEALSKTFEELKNVNDNEIKLILYYKLVKLSKVSLGNIYNRKKHIQAMETMLDKAYEILAVKKDFKTRERKVDAINAYYMEKIVSALRNKGGSLKITDDLVNKVYKNIMISMQTSENISKEKIYYDKFNLDNMSETTIKSYIKAHPFDFLTILINLANIELSKDVLDIIFDVEKLIEKKSLFKSYIKDSSVEKFSSEYFFILVFLSSGITFFNQKQQEELLPLIIMVIINLGIRTESDYDGLETYNNLVDLWKNKKQKYNDIFIEKEKIENNLGVLVSEKQELEIRNKELLKTYEDLLQRYQNYNEEFKNIVMNSEKRVLLPAYLNYDELISKKKITEAHINESKSKLGALKSMLSPEVWKDQASKIINESNIIEAEKLLIEQAKQKPYFKKEYSVFFELEEQIKELDDLVIKNKESLKDKNLLVENIRNKINELQRQLNIIKNAYLDIEEEYY